MQIYSKCRQLYLNNSEAWYVQIVKYFFVSVVAAVVDFFTFVWMYEFTDNYIVSNIVAFSLGVTVNYSLSLKFIFKKRRFKKRYEFPVFMLIGIVGLGVSTFVIYITLKLVKLGPEESKLISIAATFFWNFTMRKILLFSGNLIKSK